MNDYERPGNALRMLVCIAVVAAMSSIGAQAFALPDLTPTALTPPASGVGGSNISVTWMMSNQGKGDASGSWRDFFYRSTDATLDGGDVLLSPLAHTL